jgi:cytosine/uracil/thiamine/allantoin permease
MTHNAEVIIKPSYDPRLTNTDLAPLKQQTWSAYNIPAITRGLIAVAWYGIQTYLASSAFLVVALKFFPGLAPYADVNQFGFASLSALGWSGFIVLWLAQALVFFGAAWRRAASSSTGLVPPFTWS